LEPGAYYHAGNILFKTTDLGITWKAVSPDLTKHDTTKMGISGVPYTNEGAGGENYCTISYVALSENEKGVIYTGSDDGLVYLTKDGGNNWTNITPKDLDESLINAIDVSSVNKGTAYIAVNKYKVNDFTPIIYKTSDYGITWNNSNSQNIKLGRVRIMRLMPKRGLTVHRDTSVRYHLVLKTNIDSFFGFRDFLNKDGAVAKCYHMPANGYFYKVDTTKFHFVYNGGKTERIHIVIVPR
jgi:photosystem II stability/assembly factor-like uncharacterized protein